MCSILCMLVQVVQYLAGCGLQSCVMLVRKGYPDIGWNPVEGERYLDFLRFAVFCNGETLNSYSFTGSFMCSQLNCVAFNNEVLFLCASVVCVWHLVCWQGNLICLLWLGESVEENANVVVRLLIRRPECFGPALRGEGGDGLLAAMEEAIKISQDPSRDGPSPTSESSKTL